MPPRVVTDTPVEAEREDARQAAKAAIAAAALGEHDVPDPPVQGVRVCR